MKFTIVTPSYNQGEFLAETIESVISQAGDFHIDYIIIDGGSGDNSLEIIRQYDARLHNGEWPIKCRGITYRWVSERDRGQTEALMKGFRMAQGGVLAWLNSDDTYLPGALQAAADFLRDHPDTGLVYGDTYYSDAAGAIIGNYKTDDFDLGKLASANIICQPAAFFRKGAFEAVGGLDETLDFVMDYDLWIRIGRRFSCHHIHQMIATYRLHDASKTMSAETVTRNCEESLEVTFKHFGWAPLTRVYSSSYIRCKVGLPAFLADCPVVLAAAAMACTIFRSLRLNRGLHRNDLRLLLSRDNFCKLFKSRLEIMTGEPRWK